MQKVTLRIISIFFGLFFVFPQVSRAEIIQNFYSEINVLPDSSLIINERITYDFEKALRIGIYRDIPLSNKAGKNIIVDVISVTDDNGQPYKFSTTTDDGVFTIKIGDTEKLISGEKIYKISYKISGGVLYQSDFDEIYWNATGNGWNVPMKNIKSKVVLPQGVFPIEQKCYFGKLGSRSMCKVTDGNIFSIENLNKEEGLTVAVSFKKGAVAEYGHKKDSVIIGIAKTFWPTIIPLLVFGLMFTRWMRKGRDPKGNEVIIPEYYPPKDLSPVEASGILYETIKTRSISAEIIDLAIRGFIKIKPTEKKLLGLAYKQDYEITLLKETGFIETDFDKEIIKIIFGDKGAVGGVANLSGLNDCFYKSIPKISRFTIDSLLKKKYYLNFPKNIAFETTSIVLSIIFIFLSIAFLVWSPSDFGDAKKLAIFFVSSISSIGMALVFNFLMPSKTKKGVVMKEYLLGLKEYLQIAEKDRLAFHNAPLKKPETFEKLLPYAIVFGVEELWAKEFDGIYTKEPVWYECPNEQFSVVSFGKELSVFNTVAISSLSSCPSYSGVGNSGFSGGGVGGGGGGSW